MENRNAITAVNEGEAVRFFYLIDQHLMLDIYYIPATAAMPEDPDHLELAGSIDLDAHGSLATLFDKGRQAGADLRYSEDSTLGPAQVDILLKIFLAHAPGSGHGPRVQAAFAAMRHLLESAASRGMGLAAFCD